jgi:2-hydroxychromene-2-carboxylate isomerase
VQVSTCRRGARPLPPSCREKAPAVAREDGPDIACLESHAASDEVKVKLGGYSKLAAAIGIRSTPGYVVGDSVAFGTIGLAALRERINAERGHVEGP